MQGAGVSTLHLAVSWATGWPVVSTVNVSMPFVLPICFKKRRMAKEAFKEVVLGRERIYCYWFWDNCVSSQAGISNNIFLFRRRFHVRGKFLLILSEVGKQGDIFSYKKSSLAAVQLHLAIAFSMNKNTLELHLSSFYFTWS